MQWGESMAWREVVFQYDGTYEGFLCCVFESYTHKEFPTAFYDDEEFFTLYEVRTVQTVPAHAKRVQSSIERVSPTAGQLLRRAFFTCMDSKEERLYSCVRKLYAQGDGFLKNISDPVYLPIHRALRHMAGEVEKYRGFVRFSDYSGVLGAEIAPKNRVLPLLRRHFCSRYANERFFIYDRTHREMLLYAAGRSRIARVDGLQLDAPDSAEVFYRTLWKRFFDSVSIAPRKNPRCQNSFLPKRYRDVMTEFLPADAGTTPAMPPAEP